MKRAPTNENEEIVDTSNDEQSNGSSSSSDSVNVESSETIHKHSDACMESDHSDDQASQNKGNVATRSGRVVKSTQDNENFVYY